MLQEKILKGKSFPEGEHFMKEKFERLKRVLAASNKRIIICIVAWIICAESIDTYLNHTPITFASNEFWIQHCLILIIGLVLCQRLVSWNDALKMDWDAYYKRMSKKERVKANKIYKVYKRLTLIFIIIFFAVIITSLPICKSRRYSELIEVANGNFKEDVISSMEADDIISVDVATAQKLGDRVIGKLKNASWYEVDNEYNLVSIKGEQYRISPLKYGSLWTYWKSDGLPGYVMVNAKTQKAEYVEFKEKMQYSIDSYFSYNLYRHLQINYPTYMFGKSFFEVDDENHPYWITGIGKAKIGLTGGVMINDVIITDAISGECEKMALNEMPDWVDHALAVNYLMTRIEYHYVYANGFFNLSKTQVYRPTYSYKDEKEDDEEENEYTPFDGYNSVLSKEGEIMFYTGITPENEAETNVGFVLVSPRTGKVKYYESDGAEEHSAQLAAEGLVQDLKYSASFPTVINVSGMETYFMTLKDNAGLVKKYSLCNVKEYTQIVQADTIDEAIKKYCEKMEVEAEITESGEEPKEEDIVYGKIITLKEAQISGYTYYYFTLDTNAELVLMSSIENSNMQPLKMQAGASVEVTYQNSEEAGIGIVTKIVFK